MSQNASASFDLGTWSKGTRGILAAHATDKPKLHNMQMYPTGILGPRRLWDYVYGNTGSALGNDAALMIPLSYGAVTGVGNKIMLFHDDHASAEQGELLDGNPVGGGTISDFGSPTFDTNTTAPAQSGIVGRRNQLPVTVVDVGVVIIGGTITHLTTVSVSTLTITQHDAAAGIVATFGTSRFEAHYNAFHGGRAFYVGTGAPYTGVFKTRVRYSDLYTGSPSQLATFTSAEQYFDIPGSVRGMQSMGTVLLIWTTEGRWFVLQGRGDPKTGTLTEIDRGRIPTDWPVIMDGELYFTAGWRTGLVKVGPTGQQDDVSLRHLAFYEETPTTEFAGYVDEGRLAASSVHNTIIVDEGPDIFHFAQGVWTSQEFSDANRFTDNTTGIDYAIDDLYGAELMSVQGDDNADTPWIYARAANASGPSTEATRDAVDSYSNASAKGQVILPRISDPSQQVRVRRVVVDGIMYGSAVWDPAMLGQVTNAEGTVQLTSVGPATYDAEITALGTSGSQPFRAVLTPTEAMGHSSFLDVELYDIVMIGLERVTVEFELSNARVH